MTPVLEHALDEKEHRPRETIEALATRFALSPEERVTLLPSGKQPVFDNRVGWATTYLAKAGLLERPRRGVFRITKLGVQLAAEQRKAGAMIDNRFLATIPAFKAFREATEPSADGSPASVSSVAPVDALSPEEMLEHGYAELRAQLAGELLQRVRVMDPTAFEYLVVDLLLAMGYGGSRRDAGRAIGRSGDNGVDGVVEQDKLGLDVIYVQAKRYAEHVVIQPSDIRDFAGALGEHKATKGVFITTSSFTRAAYDSAAKAEKRIIQINGKQLAELMIDHGIGVSLGETYVVKRLDSDYFTHE